MDPAVVILKRNSYSGKSYQVVFPFASRPFLYVNQHQTHLTPEGDPGCTLSGRGVEDDEREDLHDEISFLCWRWWTWRFTWRDLISVLEMMNVKVYITRSHFSVGDDEREDLHDEISFLCWRWWTWRFTWQDLISLLEMMNVKLYMMRSRFSIADDEHEVLHDEISFL